MNELASQDRRRPGAPRLRLRGPTALVVQSFAFVRKELVEIVRQPRLVATLVFGPFVLLLLFGHSYSGTTQHLRTLFVAPAGSVYERATREHEDQLREYVAVAGITDDQSAAERRLRDGAVDIVVIFPSDAGESVLRGERAPITVLNDKLDPVQQAAVTIAARLAVQQVNASIVTGVVSAGQQAVAPMADVLTGAVDTAARLDDAAARTDTATMQAQAASLDAALAQLQRTVAIGRDVGAGAGATGGAGDDLATASDDLARARAELGPLRTGQAGPAAAARTADIRRTLGQVRPVVARLGDVDPAVLVQPFVSDTRTALPRAVDVTDFFAPSSIALLLQHLALSFAALTLVRDRSIGLLELFRVGPTSSAAVLTGRFVAFEIAGGVVGAALVAAVVHLLDVPVLGSYRWLALGIGLLLLGSTALGMCVALVSANDSQAVQYAMLLLLASLFFGGFVLDLDLFRYPARALSWLLPVTFGIRVLQDVMLRGLRPHPADVGALVVQVLVYGGVAVALFRRRLRTV